MSFGGFSKGPTLTKKSQTLASSTTASTKLSNLASEAAKRSRELVTEASKKAELLKYAALKQADQIKSFSSDLIDAIPSHLSHISIASSSTAATFLSPGFEDCGVLGIKDRSWVVED